MKTNTLAKAMLVASTIFILIGVSPQIAAKGAPHDFNRRVAGSFLLDLNLTGTDGTQFAVQALATLSADGGVVATDTDDFGLGTAAFVHSPKQGAWKKIGKRDIRITLLEFAYDHYGNLTTVFKLQFQAEFEDKKFDSGSGLVSFEAFLPGQDVLDPNTIPVATGGGDFSFQRINP